MIKLPERPALYGIWLSHGGWMLLGAESGAGIYDMPHIFFSQQDAKDWLAVRQDFANSLVVPMNAEAEAKGK